jgi:hypothetical protein
MPQYECNERMVAFFRIAGKVEEFIEKLRDSELEGVFDIGDRTRYFNRMLTDASCFDCCLTARGADVLELEVIEAGGAREFDELAGEANIIIRQSEELVDMLQALASKWTPTPPPSPPPSALDVGEDDEEWALTADPCTQQSTNQPVPAQDISPPPAKVRLEETLFFANR